MEMLFGWILESSLLILMILGLRKIFMGRIPYIGIYALWLVVLFRFLIPVNLISTPFSVSRLISAYQSSMEAVKASESKQASDSLGESVSQGILPEGVSDAAAQKAYFGKRGLKADGLAKDSIDRAKGIKQNYLKNFIEKSDIDWQTFLKRIWLAVSIVLLLCFISSNMGMIRALKQKRIWYGKRGRVGIYTVSGIKNPCLYGLFQPVIYLPEALFAAESELCVDAEELEQIITHEYVHYLHRDHIWSVFRIILVSVYWFNPLVWLAVSCSKKDAELFCDETVLRLLGEEKRFVYGELLLRLAKKNSWGDFRYSMLSMSRQGKEMEKRIRAISTYRRYPRMVLFPLFLLTALVLGTTCSTGIGSLPGWKAFSISGNKALQSAKEDEKQKETMEEPGSRLSANFIFPGNTMGGETANQNFSAGMPSNAQEWSRKIQDSISVLPHRNAFSMEETVEAGEGALPSQDSETDASEAKLHSKTYQEAFENYIYSFTEAVNTGNTDKLQQVLAVNSEVYEQQCFIAKNYYERGIREKVKSYALFQTDMLASGKVEISSQEKIKVFYADAASKLVKQSYRYTCECVDGNWLITKMEEIPQKDVSTS